MDLSTHAAGRQSEVRDVEEEGKQAEDDDMFDRNS